MSRRRAPMATAAVAVLFIEAALAFSAPTGRAHDFDETRRFVLSVEEDRVELLVAYEVRPGRAADALVARFDANHDGLATTALERLARAQTIGPRIRHGIALEIHAAPRGRGGELPLSLSRLEFPEPPDDAGRRGVAAIALYTAALPRRPTAASPLHLTFRTRGARGEVSLEAQAVAAYRLTAAGVPSRPGDPVLGPLQVRRRMAVDLTVTAVSGPG